MNFKTVCNAMQALSTSIMFRKTPNRSLGWFSKIQLFWIIPLVFSGNLAFACEFYRTPNANKISLQEYFGGAKFSKPIRARFVPNSKTRWFVASHVGVIEKIAIDGTGRENILDLSKEIEFGGQWGLQDFIFHPDYPSDPRIYITYTAKNPKNNFLQSRLSSFKLDPRSFKVDKSSEEIMLTESSRNRFHPISGLALDLDHHLFIGFGNSVYQTMKKKNFSGKILRIGISKNEPGYFIPKDNPFLNTKFPPETWAVGLRNPWRFEFETSLNGLIIGDVGARNWEEVNISKGGEDFGFPYAEGNECFGSDVCSIRDYVAPTLALSHSTAQAIIGGHIIKDRLLNSLVGSYVFADYTFSRIFSMNMKTKNIEILYDGKTPTLNVSSLTVGPLGESIVASANDWQETMKNPENKVFRFHRIVENTQPGRQSIVEKTIDLKSSKCLTSKGDFVSKAHVYLLNNPAFESGHAVKRHFVKPRTSVSRVYGPQARPELSDGAVFLKTYFLDNKKVKTEVAARVKSQWIYSVYKWGDDQKNAIKQNSAEANNCNLCHSESTGYILGATFPQLNRELPSGKNQLIQLGMVKNKELPQLLQKIAQKVKNTDRGPRSYLDINCAHCHMPNGSADSIGMDLRRGTRMADAGICNVKVIESEDDKNPKRRISPGKPEHSELLFRISTLTNRKMPPHRTNIDKQGIQMISDWIMKMDKNCIKKK